MAEVSLARLFVYGTLQTGQSAHALLQGLEGARRLGPAWVSGRLYDCGEYPGAVPDAADGARVHGELWEVAPRFERLDAFEGYDAARPAESLFLRREVEVQLGGEVVRAWTYVLARVSAGAERLDAGVWPAQRG